MLVVGVEKRLTAKRGRSNARKMEIEKYEKNVCHSKRVSRKVCPSL